MSNGQVQKNAQLSPGERLDNALAVARHEHNVAAIDWANLLATISEILSAILPLLLPILAEKAAKRIKPE